MPFALPTLEELTRRAEADMERAVLAARPDADAAAVARAVRSERGMLAAHVRTVAQGLFNAHLHLRWWGDQYLPDSSENEFLVRHAAIWGIERRPATRAVGFASFTGQPGLVIPAGLQATTPGGAIVETTLAGVLSVGGSATLPFRALMGGADGNASGLTELPLVSPLPGLDRQTATLDSAGLAGGAGVEEDGDLLARILERIRQPAHGGAAFDYRTWIQNRFAAAKVAVAPGWVGRGSVGVIVAMGTAAAPRVPTGAELAEMLAYLGDINSVAGVRPVTAEVVMVAYVQRLVNLNLAIAPDTGAIREAVQSAFKGFLAREAEIGQPVPLSRISEALSGAAGEYKHRITVPAGDIICLPRELAEPGAITWGVY